MNVTLSIGRIEAQKDEYAHMKDGKPFGEAEADFFESNEKKAIVDHFKRFVVDGTIRGTAGGTEFPLRAVISLRGNIVTVTAPDKQGPFRPYHVFYALEKEVSKWSFRYRGTGGRDDSPLRAIEVDPIGDRIVCTTFDGFWLADVLHHLRDRGAFQAECDSNHLRKVPGI